MHDGLKYGGEGRDADASADEYGMLRPVDVARWGPEWPVNVDLQQDILLGHS